MKGEFKFDVPRQGERQPHTWVVAGDVIICLTMSGEISTELWGRFLESVRLKDVKSILGLSYETVAVNSVQRKAVSEASKGYKLGGVFTSTVTRGIITALGWLGLNIKAFSWTNLEEAVQYITADSKRVTAEQALVLVKDLLKLSNAPSLETLQGKEK